MSVEDERLDPAPPAVPAIEHTAEVEADDPGSDDEYLDDGVEAADDPVDEGGAFRPIGELTDLTFNFHPTSDRTARENLDEADRLLHTSASRSRSPSESPSPSVSASPSVSPSASPSEGMAYTYVDSTPVNFVYGADRTLRTGGRPADVSGVTAWLPGGQNVATTPATATTPTVRTEVTMPVTLTTQMVIPPWLWTFLVVLALEGLIVSAVAVTIAWQMAMHRP